MNAKTVARNLGSFVPSLGFAGSNQQNMHRVSDAVIAAVRNEFPQANAITGVMGSRCSWLSPTSSSTESHKERTHDAPQPSEFATHCTGAHIPASVIHCRAQRPPRKLTGLRWRGGWSPVLLTEAGKPRQCDAGPPRRPVSCQGAELRCPQEPGRRDDAGRSEQFGGLTSSAKTGLMGCEISHPYFFF
jgi:hypothetical protein